MTVPYTEEDTIIDSQGQCNINEDIVHTIPIHNVTSLDTVLCCSIVSDVQYPSMENILKNKLLLIAVLHIGIRSYVMLHTMLYLQLQLWTKCLESRQRELKMDYLFHKVKIKVKWPNIQWCKLGWKTMESERIFKHIIRPLRFIPRCVLNSFPFLPKEYTTLINDRRHHHRLEVMKYEGSRFASFSDFPIIEGIYATRLAEAGFFYTGNEDEVECYSCNIRHRNWKKGDVPKDVHGRISPNCSLVGAIATDSKDNICPSQTTSIGQSGTCGSTRDLVEKETAPTHNYNSTNGPIISQISGLNGRIDIKEPYVEQLSGSNGVNLQRQVSKDCVTSSFQNRPVSDVQSSKGENCLQTPSKSYNDTNSLIRVPENQQASPPVRQSTTENYFSQQENRSQNPLEAVNMGICIDKPKYPKYAIKSVRLETFKTWPRHLTQLPEEMVHAGFFYTGIEDHCRCFFCGGGLKNWESGDRPWIEHARWYKNCAYLQQCKGDKFIEDIHLNRLNSDQNQDVERVPSTSTRDQKADFSNHPAVVSVSDFGYDPNLVKKAFDLLRQSESLDITGTMLLEKIFNLEESMSRNISVTSANTEVRPNIPTEKQTVSMENREQNNTETNEVAKKDLGHELSIRSLEEENQNLKDQQTCKICLDEPIGIVFLPCGHMACCVNCAPALRRCPICRTFIKGTVKAIMS